MKSNGLCLSWRIDVERNGSYEARRRCWLRKSSVCVKWRQPTTFWDSPITKGQFLFVSKLWCERQLRTSLKNGFNLIWQYSKQLVLKWTLPGVGIECTSHWQLNNKPGIGLRLAIPRTSCYRKIESSWERIFPIDPQLVEPLLNFVDFSTRYNNIFRWI